MSSWCQSFRYSRYRILPLSLHGLMLWLLTTSPVQPGTGLVKLPPTGQQHPLGTWEDADPLVLPQIECIGVSRCSPACTTGACPVFRNPGPLAVPECCMQVSTTLFPGHCGDFDAMAPTAHPHVPIPQSPGRGQAAPAPKPVGLELLKLHVSPPSPHEGRSACLPAGPCGIPPHRSCPTT